MSVSANLVVSSRHLPQLTRTGKAKATLTTVHRELQMPTFADLFCGGGFGARGAVRGGGVPLFGLDAWELATDTYKANFPQAEVLTERIEKVDAAKLAKRIRPDVLLTSPECTAHSIARGAKPGLETSRETAIGIVPSESASPNQDVSGRHGSSGYTRP